MTTPGYGYYSAVARHILCRHAPPDLRGAVVLLPNYHAAVPLAQALSRSAGMPALLPCMTTLSDWAGTVQLDTAVQSDTQRIAALYQALRGRDWFPDANLWSLSRELLALMDELTCHHVALPDSVDAFARQLGEAYQARTGQAMQFEARVVHELWYAMAASAEPDAPTAYQLQLAILAQRVTTPLYVLQTCDPGAPDARFIAACRERVEVTVFDLRAMINADPACTLLASALQQEQDSRDLRSIAGGFNTGDLRQRISLFGAHGMEQEAQAANVAVRRWLLEGRLQIASLLEGAGAPGDRDRGGVDEGRRIYTVIDPDLSRPSASVDDHLASDAKEGQKAVRHNRRRAAMELAHRDEVGAGAVDILPRAIEDVTCLGQLEAVAEAIKIDASSLGGWHNGQREYEDRQNSEFFQITPPCPLRADRPSHAPQPGRGEARSLRLHRGLFQSEEAALIDRLPRAIRVRAEAQSGSVESTCQTLHEGGVTPSLAATSAT